MITVENLQFSFSSQRSFFFPSFDAQKGEKVFISGASGSGKTTFLHLLAGVLKASGGLIKCNKSDLTGMSGAQRDRFRKDHMGYVFQQLNLVHYLTLRQNIALPLAFSTAKKARACNKFQNISNAIDHYITSLDMNDPKLPFQKAASLSQGQQQRVAVARACIGMPEIILADEPTSSLDQENTTACMKMLINQCEQNDSTLIFVGHDLRLASYFDRHINIADLMEQA